MKDATPPFVIREPLTRLRWWTTLGVGLFSSFVLLASVPAAQAESGTMAASMERTDVKQAVEDAPEIADIKFEGAELSPEQQTRFDRLMAADQLYLDGKQSEARKLYQQAKLGDEKAEAIAPLPEPTFDAENGAVKVYWREGTAGLELGLESKVIVPLTLLTSQHPEFIPGHLKLAQGHNQFGRPEEALTALERGASFYPNVPELQEALVQQQASMKRWLPAAITARQFATLNPDHEKAAEFAQLAEEYQQKFRAALREDLTGNAIGSVLSGAINVGIFGDPFGAIAPIQNTVALLRGEESVGSSAAKSYQKKLPMVEDESLNAYVNRIGQKLAAVSGRELNYEFFVINDEQVNAFALPGGKIFVTSGAILKARSEAELAGLLAHELSHAVLSHGFQMYTQSNVMGGSIDLVPFRGLFAKVAVTKYTRDLEQQADLLGTRILVNAGYAADGLENLVQTLHQAEDDKPQKGTWLSIHPDTEERVQYLADLIKRHGYNRYAYEGVREHAQMKGLAQVALTQLLEEDKDAAISASDAQDNASSLAER